MLHMPLALGCLLASSKCSVMARAQQHDSMSTTMSKLADESAPVKPVVLGPLDESAAVGPHQSVYSCLTRTESLSYIDEDISSIPDGYTAWVNN